MIYSSQKKFIIIIIIAIIIIITDNGNANNDKLINLGYEWARLYITRIVIRLNIMSNKKMSHRKLNKLMKIINGNRFYKKPVKMKKHFTFVTLNKGKSHFNSDSKRFLPIKTEIMNQNGDIVLLSEAEFNPID